ncbi:hypothetical protein PFICI_14630 [Pestalotiopsis fici W106-1]|uniref:Phosphatidylinositol glycan, class Q n=1 Tax=Pestalotiopsis fici (strain W106-1 / CGMCC3.15140) TaxID=1229662 RepID=W3WIS5_PESFW|nr:uncharacterized protein PFICI_14630 [Pestalotiopsis fici W106-1]ETS73684.1 hypothetical protein PFICI_14630 [Pestalotiopsis fici W106-1]
MHPFSVVTLAIFVAGYGTARWDLVTRLYELALFAWDKGVITRAAQGFAFLTLVFLVVFLPVHHLARLESQLVRRPLCCASTLRDIALGINASDRPF